MMFLAVDYFDCEKVACKLQESDVDQLDAILNLFYRCDVFTALSALVLELRMILILGCWVLPNIYSVG